MDEYLNLFGMKIRLSGDTKAARKLVAVANKVMFQTKLQNVQDLDIISGHMKFEDGTRIDVLSQHGLDSAMVYVPPEPSGGGKEEVFTEVIEKDNWTFRYCPAFVALDSSHNHIGYVVCISNGFSNGYNFVSKEELFLAVKDKEGVVEETILYKDFRFVGRNKYVFDDNKALGMLQSKPKDSPITFWYPQTIDKWFYLVEASHTGSEDITATHWPVTCVSSFEYDSDLRGFVLNFFCPSNCPPSYPFTMIKETGYAAYATLGYKKTANSDSYSTSKLILQDVYSYELFEEDVNLDESLYYEHKRESEFSYYPPATFTSDNYGESKVEFTSSMYYCPEDSLTSSCQQILVVRESSEGLAIERALEDLEFEIEQAAAADAEFIASPDILPATYHFVKTRLISAKNSAVSITNYSAIYYTIVYTYDTGNSDETIEETKVCLNGEKYGLGISEELKKSTLFYPISITYGTETSNFIGLYRAYTEDKYIYAMAVERSNQKGEITKGCVITEFDINDGIHLIPNVTYIEKDQEGAQPVYGYGSYMLVKQYTKQKTKYLRTTTKKDGVVVGVHEEEII